MASRKRKLPALSGTPTPDVISPAANGPSLPFADILICYEQSFVAKPSGNCNHNDPDFTTHWTADDRKHEDEDDGENIRHVDTGDLRGIHYSMN